MYLTIFYVTGSSVFPLDMLRYDHCYPLRTEDAMALETPTGARRLENRTVRLVATSTNPKWGPVFDRWNSFGWGVTKIEATREVE